MCLSSRDYPLVQLPKATPARDELTRTRHFSTEAGP